ncbi:MAG: hypothetical protein HYU48_00070 [Candidatus Levybacteria bacterium]|nr:hypothetical protein [Candidatus Levybacteria bacterium]
MSFEERFRGQVPKNDYVALVRRTKRDFGLMHPSLPVTLGGFVVQRSNPEVASPLDPVKKRLLETGALDIIEELLELVDGSEFEVSSDTMGMVSRMYDFRTLRDYVKFFFKWGITDSEDEDTGYNEVNEKKLEITAGTLNENIAIESSSGMAISSRLPNGRLVGGHWQYTKLSSRILTPQQWRDRTGFESVIMEALTLAGLTQRQLKGDA